MNLIRITHIFIILLLQVHSLSSMDGSSMVLKDQERPYPVGVGTKILTNLASILSLDHTDINREFLDFNRFITNILTKSVKPTQETVERKIAGVITTLKRIMVEKLFSEKVQAIASLIEADLSTLAAKMVAVETAADVESLIVGEIPAITVKEFLLCHNEVREEDTRCQICQRGYFKQSSSSRGKTLECLLCNHRQASAAQIVARMPAQAAVKEIPAHRQLPIGGSIIFDGCRIDDSEVYIYGANLGIKRDLRALDLETIKSTLVREYLKVDRVSGRGTVFFIGNTGSGKSTLINALLGCKMRMVEGGFGRDRLEPVEGNVIAAVGHGRASLFPQVYENADSSLCFVDCPGFADSWAAEGEICASILSQVAAYKASNIRCLAIMRDSELDSGRGASFLNLLSMLSNLFHTDPDHELPVTLVVNQTRSFATERQIKRHIMDLTEHLLGNGDQKTEILSMLRMIRSDVERYVSVINVLDDSLSVHELITKLHALPPIRRELLNFYGPDHIGFRFKDVIGRIAAEMVAILRNKKSIEGRIRNYMEWLADIEKNITTHTSRIEEITRDAVISKEECRKVQLEASISRPIVEREADAALQHKGEECGALELDIVDLKEAEGKLRFFTERKTLMENSLELAQKNLVQDEQVYREQLGLCKIVNDVINTGNFDESFISVQEFRSLYTDNESPGSTHAEEISPLFPVRTSCCAHLFNRLEIVEWQKRNPDASCTKCSTHFVMEDLIPVPSIL